MSQIVECVPNFSEGRDQTIIQAIADAISGTNGCTLLDVDAGPSTNRTVYTFVGSPISCVEGALNAARVAAKLINMESHKGEHPRLGVMDVCPFVPVRNVTLEECAECARKTGQRLSEMLDVPVYLYGAAADKDYRRTVPQIRAGEYEGLADKLTLDIWKPDYGAAAWRPRWGASIVGARNFLVAYNVNLLSTKEQAHRIALNIRESGRSAKEAGRLKAVQGIGWYLKESNLAQVSINITDLSVTGIHTVFEEVKKDATELGLAVAGSQIVGLVPLQAIEQAATFYIEKEGLCILEQDQRTRLAIDRLGLHSLGVFLPEKRIVEKMIESAEGGSDGALARLTLRQLILTVAERTPSPGGGSVAAIIGALGTALATMAGLLTYGNRKFEQHDSIMRQLLPRFYNGMLELIEAVDKDAVAFDNYMTACKMSAVSESEKFDKIKAKAVALKQCAQVPFDLARRVDDLWKILVNLAQVVNMACLSDVQVAAKCLETAVFGARCNVLTNLTDMDEGSEREEFRTNVESLWSNAQMQCTAVLQALNSRSG